MALKTNTAEGLLPGTAAAAERVFGRHKNHSKATESGSLVGCGFKKQLQPTKIVGSLLI